MCPREQITGSLLTAIVVRTVAVATALSLRLGLYCIEQSGQPVSLQIEILKLDTSLSRFCLRAAKPNVFVGVEYFNSCTVSPRISQLLGSKTPL